MSLILRRSLAVLLCYAGTLLLLTALELPPEKLVQIQAAARAGDPQAQDQLGNYHESHLEKTNALAWYRLAAAQGVANSQWHLGQMLLTSAFDRSGKLILPGRSEEAIQWYLKAANQDNHQAQFELGRFFETGHAVKPDLVEAYQWYTLALKGGGRGNPAKPSLARLTTQLSPEQVADGKKRVEKFLSTRPVGPLVLQQFSPKTIPPSITIAGQIFTNNMTADVLLDGRTVKIRCLEIRADSALVQVAGEVPPRLLRPE